MMLEHQQEQLREQTRLLQLILARGSAHDAVPSELPEGISFPLKTVKELAAFEERMSQANAATSVVSFPNIVDCLFVCCLATNKEKRVENS